MLHSHPSLAARDLCSKHIVKMPTESLSMLATAAIRHGAQEYQLPLTRAGTPVKKTHEKHPSTIWAGNTRSNFDWLCIHAKTICHEYTKAYGKIHFCEKGIDALSSLNCLIPEGPLEPFAIAINEKMNCRKSPNFESMSVVEKYREYYRKDKSSFAKWEKGRQKPDWFDKTHELV